MNKEPIVMPVQRNSISPSDKAKLSKAGIIVIEHENPDSLRMLRPSISIDSSDMLKAAMKALNSFDGTTASQQREMFTKLMAAFLADPEPTEAPK